MTKKNNPSLTPKTEPIFSQTFTPEVNAEIRRAAATGIYDIRGGGSKRRIPHFDDLLFLGASMSRYPLEGYSCLLYTSPSPRDATLSRMPSSA